MKEIDLLEVGGFRAGHAQDREAGTGCTVPRREWIVGAAARLRVKRRCLTPAWMQKGFMRCCCRAVRRSGLTRQAA